MQRFEVVADRKANPAAVGALERAFARLATGDTCAIRAVAVGESAGRLLIRIDLAVDSARRARRRGEGLVARAWYDAFGERDPGLRCRITGLRAQERTGERRPAGA